MKATKRFAGIFLILTFVLQAVFAYPVFAKSIAITKFTTTNKKPAVNETVLFRVRTEGEIESVYMSVDGGKDIQFSQKSNNIWEKEQKFTIEGVRYIKVTINGVNKEKDSITDTIEVISKTEAQKNKAETTTTETTTERTYTGNIEKTTETTTEAVVKDIPGSDEFDGGEYNEESNVDDLYFELAPSEDMPVLNEVAGNSVFLFIGESTLINKWQKQPIDSSNPNVKSYVKGGRTFVPLRAISEAFNADVQWDNDTKTASISLLDNNVQITVNANSMIVNGKDVSLDAPSEIVDGRVFVPIRAISESLNKNVYYNDGFVGITSKGQEVSDNGFILIKQAALRLN